MERIILYTKQRCHLCDEMKLILTNIQSSIPFQYEEIDIETDKALSEKYKEKIPVLMVDGKMFAKYTVDEMKLRTKLNNL
ncbi:MAG: glutaredoxin family protein [bacterium]|nr:glutaredoxin family protein [bacterium]